MEFHHCLERFWTLALRCRALIDRADEFRSISCGAWRNAEHLSYHTITIADPSAAVHTIAVVDVEREADVGVQHEAGISAVVSRPRPILRSVVRVPHPPRPSQDLLVVPLVEDHGLDLLVHPHAVVAGVFGESVPQGVRAEERHAVPPAEAHLGYEGLFDLVAVLGAGQAKGRIDRGGAADVPVHAAVAEGKIQIIVEIVICVSPWFGCDLDYGLSGCNPKVSPADTIGGVDGVV
mmetsp:Transcript_18530/g.37554  ORF Transcript_18530/g.37554 Transcript_18530/m.37554 type:complete len:235 (+) Transcript_18530:598-1302(+)